MGLSTRASVVLAALTLLLLAREPAAAEIAPLRVASSGDYAPFSYEEEGGKLAGLDAEIAERLALDLGLALRWVRFAWPELEGKLERGEFHVAASGVTMRPDRAVAGLYTRPYAVTGAVALVRADGPIVDLAGLRRPTLRLIVNAGGHLERTARSLFPLARIAPTADNWSLAEEVRNGRADAAITDSAEARQWMDRSLRAVGPLTHDHKALLLPAAQAELAERIDDWLRQRERDGWLPARRARWLGAAAAADEHSMAREAIVALIELRLGLMPAVAAAKRQAAQPIEDPAQEKRVLARVRAAAGEGAPRVERVYEQMIETAKSIQRQVPSTAAAAPLDRLRAAIARVDVALVRELRDRPPTTASSWQAVLDRNLRPLAVDAAQISGLAAALSADGADAGSRVGSEADR
jgi:cyclohexadienyl dehydratase